MFKGARPEINESHPVPMAKLMGKEDWPEWSKQFILAFVVKYPHMQEAFEKESLPDFTEEEAAALEEARGFRSPPSGTLRQSVETEKTDTYIRGEKIKVVLKEYSDRRSRLRENSFALTSNIVQRISPEVENTQAKDGT